MIFFISNEQIHTMVLKPLTNLIWISLLKKTYPSGSRIHFQMAAETHSPKKMVRRMKEKQSGSKNFL